MLRELTLSVDETLYDALMPMVEKKNIGNLLAEFVREQSAQPSYTQAELEAGYRAMAADEEYERQATEWSMSTENPGN